MLPPLVLLLTPSCPAVLSPPPIPLWLQSEENKLAWSKQRLAELVPGAEAAEAGDAGWCARVTAVKSVTGEVRSRHSSSRNSSSSSSSSTRSSNSRSTSGSGSGRRSGGLRQDHHGRQSDYTTLCSICSQAMLTTRKGNKRFAFYDLKLTLAWEAAPPSAAEPDAAAAAGGRAAAGAEATVAGVAAAEGVAGMSLGAAAGAEAAAGGDGSDAVAAPAAEASPAAASAAVVTGEMSIAELASGSDSDDLEVTISVSGGCPLASPFSPLYCHHWLQWDQQGTHHVGSWF